MMYATSEKQKQKTTQQSLSFSRKNFRFLGREGGRYETDNPLWHERDRNAHLLSFTVQIRLRRV